MFTCYRCYLTTAGQVCYRYAVLRLDPWFNLLLFLVMFQTLGKNLSFSFLHVCLSRVTNFERVMIILSPARARKSANRSKEVRVAQMCVV